MRVLITGGSSLLGKALYQTVLPEHKLIMTWFTNTIGLPAYQFDVCNQSQIAYVFDLVKPEVVIHCAAIGSVDLAEKDYQTVYTVNVTGTENILTMAQAYRAKFVYISSNAVFDGNNPPYSETSERHPINRYGSIKRQAEDAVMKCYNWLIIRPFLMYGWPWSNGRQNWMTIVRDKLIKGEKLQLVNDIYWQPTLAQDVARAIWQLIEVSPRNEIYHVASIDRMTLYQFGELVADRFGLDKQLLEPVSREAFSHLAPRPIDTTYDVSKIAMLGITCKSVEEGLKEL